MSWPASIELSSSVLMKRTKCLGSREPLLIFLHYRRLFPSWLWFLICCNLLFVGQSAERPFLSRGSQWLRAAGREDYSDGWTADTSLGWKSREDTSGKIEAGRRSEVDKDLNILNNLLLVLLHQSFVGSIRYWRMPSIGNNYCATYTHTYTHWSSRV